MSSYLDKTGLERVWSKATDKFATIATTDELKGNIETLTSTKADKTEVETAVAGLVDSAPETLNTLNELAAALGDDPNFATTIATEVGKKVNSSEYNDAIAGINANIASITPEKIGALNKEEYLGPVVLEGNPIVYESGTEGLGIAAVSYLEPKQEGSGDPYPGGGGKNIFPEWAESSYTMNGVTFTKQADGSIRAQGTPAAYAYITLTDYKTLKEHGFAEGVYTISGLPEASDAWFVDLIGDANTQNINFYQNGSFDLTDEIEGNGTYAWRIVITNKVSTVDLTFKPQVEKGSTATSYAPYSNIRPITGYDKLNLGAVGKNLFNLNQTYDSFIDSIITGDVITTTFRSNGALHIKEGDVHPAGAYTLTIVPVSGLESFIAWLYYADNDEEKEIFRFNSTNLSAAFIADRPFKIGFSGIYRNPDHVCSYKVQLEVGSATPYKPHQGKTHTVQIGQTVYGGRFEWLTGKLADDVYLYELNISDMNNEDAYPGWRGVPGLADIVGVGLDTYMNVSGGFVASNISADAVAFGVNTRNGSETLFLSTEYFGMTQSEWKARHPDLKVQLACVRKHPIEIQLTPTQISELEGINTLYGDGSNIRAIFNTTGSASPVLESISGILPVEKGGTGSMSAAGARNNLGITPENIGALPVDGTAKEANALKSQQNFGSGHLDFAPDSLLYKHGIDHTAEGMFPSGNNATGLLTLNTYPFDSNFYFQMGFSVTDGLIYTRAFNGKVIDTTTPWVELLNTSNFKNHVTPQNIGALGNSGRQKIADGTLVVGNRSGNASNLDLYTDDTNTTLRFLKDGENNTNNLSLYEEYTILGKPLTVSSGGTGATTSEQARANLLWIGYNPITSAVNDTVENWKKYGSGSLCMYNQTNQLIDQPSQYGLISTYSSGVNSTEIHQIWMTQANGDMLHRGGNAEGWSGTWRKILDSSNYTSYTVTKTGSGASGTWGINVTGNAATASAFNSARSIELIGAVYGTVSSNGASGWTINTTIAEKAITPTNFTSTFRTQTKGDAANGAFLSVIRNDAEDSWGYMPRYGTGIAFGRWDTHTYLYTDYQNPVAYIGGGSGDSLHWVRRFAFTDGIGAYGTWGINITGNAATATSLSGTLAVNKGGTGITSNPSMLVNLSSTSAASVFAASPRPGITGTLAIGNGGTGATSKSGARTNLGITSGTSLPSSASAGDIFFLYS